MGAKIAIETKDGRCDAWVFRPDGAGPWPAVIVYMDGIGMRPAIHAIAARIAKRGYFVLLPDLFYRSGPYQAIDPAKLFADAEVRKEWFAKHIASATIPKVVDDTRAFLAFLDAQPDVKHGAIGATGYCMGGRLSFAMAAHFPERIAAAASFHPGGLATDAADSPHLLAPRIEARVYVGGASEDPSFPAEAQARVDQALASAGVDHVVETYAARHGWVPTDTPVHDPREAERHFDALFALFDAKLGH